MNTILKLNCVALVDTINELTTQPVAGVVGSLMAG